MTSSLSSSHAHPEIVLDVAGDPVDGHIWIFGYGSLIWKPSFRHTAAHRGFISGWKRRFWQGSRDHRGTPEKPGRVVTLIRAQPEDGELDRICYGMVYRVEAGDKQKVLAYLDFREQGGYTHAWMDVTVADEAASFSQVKALVYMATEDNEDYVGYAPEEEIAKQVAGCAGASGPNSEYVLRLAKGMHDMGVVDPHLVKLEALLAELADVPCELPATSTAPSSSSTSSSGYRHTALYAQTSHLVALSSATSLSPTTLAFGAISRSFSFCSASLSPEMCQALARATSTALEAAKGPSAVSPSSCSSSSSFSAVSLPPPSPLSAHGSPSLSASDRDGHTSSVGHSRSESCSSSSSRTVEQSLVEVDASSSI